MKGSRILGIIFHILGIIVAVALIVFSAKYPVPSKHVYVSSSSQAYYYSWDDNRGAEYIGGDCYNYQIEASLKAGYLAGVLAMKSITFVGGLLLLFLSLYSRVRCHAIEEQTRVITEMVRQQKVGENEEPHSSATDTLLSASDNSTTPDEECNSEKVDS